MEDFMKVAMDYRIFETGMDAGLLKDRMAELRDVILYETFYGLSEEEL